MRTRELRKKKGISQAELGDYLGVTRSTICQYEQEKRQPDNETLIKIADYFCVSVDYLLGRSEIKKAPSKFDVAQIDDKYSIPLLGRISASIPLESQENLEGYICVGYTPPREYFALRVKDQSMINAGIKDKSILIVHKQAYAENGDVVVALINGESTVKRFKTYGDSLFLMPENLTFEPIPVTKSDNFLILGRVVEVRITL